MVSLNQFCYSPASAAAITPDAILVPHLEADRNPISLLVQPLPGKPDYSYELDLSILNKLLKSLGEYRASL